MLKHRDIPIASTNMANFGTELEKNIKHHAAEGEPAWKTAGKNQGLEAWRIKQFKLEPVPAKAIGTFYDGDSYIVLKTTKVGNELSWEIFFWLGQNTSQDEAGTAAYKTVELDDFFNGAPVEHREVQGYESEEFVQLFSAKGGIRILSGGYETGFHHVKPEQYKPRLLHVQGTTAKNVRVHEVELKANNLNSSDVFILDAGLKIYQFNGKLAKPIERNKGAVLSNAIVQERENGADVIVVDEDGGDLAPFWAFFGGPQKIPEACAQEPAHIEPTKALYQFSDASGSLKFTKVGEGQLNRSSLNSNDVFILDSGDHVTVWVGKGASAQERKYALQRALDYFKQNNRPSSLPISKISEGHENEAFKLVFAH
jgi:gelsolin